jgi:two-component system sensor histidine kinase/response regulator
MDVKRMTDRLIIKCRIIIFLFTLLITGASLGQENPVKIGVLAIRGAEQCVEKWSPTAQYLSARIPDKTFVIIPLDHEQIYPSVERGEVDFILTNPSFYVELEHRYETNRIATLKNRCLDRFYTRYWGVIFWRADRSDIRQINDLKGKTFMATAEGSFGGWRMVWRELKEMGIDPYRDFKDLKFGDTQDAVVYAVRDGKVDGGTVRADTFISMHAEGKIDLKDFYVPHEHGEKTVDCPPFPHSTRGYPEWPMAKVKGTPDELAEKVATALIEMPSDSPAAIAAKCGGWTIPMNYQSVRECLKYLKISPYKDLGRITILDVIRNYWYWILLTAFLFIMMISFTITILFLNRKIRASHFEVHDTRAYTRGLIESSLDALVTFDEKGIITDVNEQTIKLTECTREELIGSQFRDYFTDPERADLGVKSSFEEEKVTDYELVMKSKRGNETVVSYNATVYRDEKGQVKGVFAAARDISETKRMLRELEATRAYTRGLIESSLDALVTFDEKGIITDVNEQTIKLTECTREELIGSQFRDYFTDPERADLGVKSSFEEEKVTDYELVMKSKRGNETVVSYNATVYRDEKGQVKGVFAAARDISESKRVEKELIKAKEAAEAATIAKSEFLANMSHEIRTPMHGVIAATELALNEEMPPKTEHYLKLIQSSAYSLLGIINDILDFSKIEADKLDIERHPFLLDEIIDRITDVFMSEAARKRIELLVDIDLEAPNALIGDPLRLQQILKNLVSNAVKFTEIGGTILVKVKESEKSADRTTLTFSVKDTGIGIAPKYLSRLFKPFSQVDTSSTREYEGTGLGLSICKRLVEMMGGRIWVESELGKGSTFGFTVCFRRQSADQKQKLVPPNDIQHLNVLVVDDCADSRLIMQKMLESFGLRVKSVSSGEESLKALKENEAREEPFELVVIDWMMPGLGGIETSKRIRKDLKLTIPIILMTAFGKENEILDAEKAGVNAFLTKPIHQSTLFNAIMDTFGKKALKIEEKEKHITTRATIYKNLLRGIRILVAEDNPTNQEIALAILEGAGIIVEIANNGKKAVEALQRSRFDAVLMDIQMPEMDGYEATKMIRKDSKFKSLPIIAMTAHAMKGDEEKCLEAGMDGYVSKPINQDRLFHTIWKSMEYQKREPYPMEPEAPEAMDIKVKQIEDLPERLPGINIQDALSALNIEKTVFKHILIGFLKNNKESANKIRDAFDKKNMEILVQLAHSLKGSAGNIGASDLHKAAQELETAGREGVPTSALFERVETDLNQVLESLQLLVDTSKTELLPGKEFGVGPGVDPAQVIPVLKQLGKALDLAEPEEIKKHMEVIKKYLDNSILRNLEDQVNDYEYDRAQKSLKGIMEEMESRLE